MMLLMKLQKKPECCSLKLLLSWIKHFNFMKQWKGSYPPPSKGIVSLKYNMIGLGAIIALREFVLTNVVIL